MCFQGHGENSFSRSPQGCVRSCHISQMLLYLIISPQSTFHLFFSANLWGDQSNSLVLKRKCWTAELCGIVRNKWQTGTRLPNPASNNVAEANGLLHSVQGCMTFLIKKKKGHLSQLDLHGEHKGSVTSCHSLAWLRNRLCVAAEEWLCGCVAVLTDCMPLALEALYHWAQLFCCSEYGGHH